ncbi:hypothetical protein JHK82_053561 [Glycine max]|nr:hypothetical protein JHK85_054355 [Glycine max]KAG5086164.1 hypothetical protein JHK82_053561 [Glycine max]
MNQQSKRKHALEQAQALGIKVQEAETRVFSNTSDPTPQTLTWLWRILHGMMRISSRTHILTESLLDFDYHAPGAGMTEKSKVFEMAQKDGKKHSPYIADTTTANAQVCTLAQTVRFDARTMLLNRKWYEEACCLVDMRVLTRLRREQIQWRCSATLGQVDKWVYEEANTNFIHDMQMLNKPINTNPNFFRKLV